MDAVVLYGGFNVPGHGLNDTWIWDGTNWTEFSPATNPGGLWVPGIDFDPLSAGRVMFGGEITGDPFANSTWLFLPAPFR
jgi:hypothetical protein